MVYKYYTHKGSENEKDQAGSLLREVGQQYQTYFNMDMNCTLTTESADVRVLFAKFIKFPMWPKPKEKLLITRWMWYYVNNCYLPKQNIQSWAQFKVINNCSFVLIFIFTYFPECQVALTFVEI